MKHTLLKLLIAILLNTFLNSAHSQQYVIPVVFHILHTGSNTNISDAQVEDAIRILNEDYNKGNDDSYFVIDYYKTNVANMGIEFRLAKLDPNGQCTNGIERIYSNQTYQGQSSQALINQWPPQKYLNIWVFDKMLGGIGGYTSGPFNYNANYDGIAILNDYVGSIGTSNAQRSRALTYETGKYLGLLNVDGGFDCVDDSVSDTPPMQHIYSCNTNALACDSITPANVQNFMCYSYCSCMFTNGQKTRVRNILDNYAVRSNLCTTANLAATGTSTNSPRACAPIADFYTTRTFACIGDSVKFVDASYNAGEITRQWQFTNANISNSGDSTVSVTFNTKGLQSVTLQVSNQYGSTSVVKQLVYVSDGQNLSVPYYSSFDDVNDLNQNWAIANLDNDAPKFEHNVETGHTGYHCLKLNNYNSVCNRNVDEIYTPVFNCSTLNNNEANLNLWYSWATRDTGLAPFDSLVIYGSKTCGKTWNRIYSAAGNSLLNAGYVANSFTPNTNAHWERINVILPSTGAANLRVPNVSFKIQVYGSAKGNNLYIDDFSIGAEPVTGMEVVSELAGITVSPNPHKQMLSLNNVPAGMYAMEVANAGGQIVLQNKNVQPDAGGNIQVNIQAQPVGLYFITLRSTTAAVTLQAIKQ